MTSVIFLKLNPMTDEACVKKKKKDISIVPDEQLEKIAEKERIEIF